MVELTHGAWTLGLNPELGGSVTHLRFEGRDLLRPTPRDAADVLQTASFPLVPFANRIGQGRFRFRDREVTLRPNLGDHPHALHGQGWRAAWTLVAQQLSQATLGFDHEGGEWPWAYAARQIFELGDRGLTVRLAVVNLADEPAPMGLGFHPCFPGKSTARLQAHLDGVWLADDLCLATRRVEGLPFGDWAAGASVNTPELVDHCHTGWDGMARIVLADAGVVVTMTASRELGFLHIYTPPDQDSFCVEPVSHRPDALNAGRPVGDGVRVLAPGEEWTVEMKLSAQLS